MSLLLFEAHGILGLVKDGVVALGIILATAELVSCRLGG